MTETNASPEAAAGALAAVAFLRTEHYSFVGYADDNLCSECCTSFPCDVIETLDRFAASPFEIHDECAATAADLAAAVADRNAADARAAQSLASAVQAVRGQLGINRDATDQDVQEASVWRTDMEQQLKAANRVIWSLQTDNASLAAKASEARADRDEALAVVDDALRSERTAQAAGATEAERLATISLILGRPST